MGGGGGNRVQFAESAVNAELSSSPAALTTEAKIIGFPVVQPDQASVVTNLPTEQLTTGIPCRRTKNNQVAANTIMLRWGT